MGRLRLEDCKSMQDYLNQHELLKLDILEANGSYDDTQLISKIFRGLSWRYNNFVDQYHLLNENDDIKLKDITTKLLTYESKLLERNEDKRNNARDKKAKEDKKDSKEEGKSKEKKKCSYEPCGKIGHLEEDCRTKKRHLAEKDNDKNKGNPKSENDRSKPEGRRQIVAMVQNIDIENVKKTANTPDHVRTFKETMDGSFGRTEPLSLTNPIEKEIQDAVSAQLMSELEYVATHPRPSKRISKDAEPDLDAL